MNSNASPKDRDTGRKQSAISKLTSRSFKTNRGRNLVAICAIILTTLMFTTLFVLSESINKNLIEMTFRQTGYDTQVSMDEITDIQIEQIAAHPDVATMGRSIVIGVAANEKLAGWQVELRYANDAHAEHVFAYPTTGRMPENDSEVALDDITLNRLGVPHELGQTVTLEWRDDFSSDEIKSGTFTLCGVWEGNANGTASMAWVAESFALEAAGGAETNAPGSFLGMRQAMVQLHSDKNIEAAMDKILADVGLAELDYNVNLAYNSGMQTMALTESLPMYFGMLLALVAGYLIIYNIFQISVATDIKFYGKLKTLGTTGKQIRKLLYGQATRLCLIGIPVGLLLGYLLGVVLVPVLISFSDTSSASANPIIFLGSAVFAYLTVLISCLRPARIAGKVSPIEALRYNDSQSGKRRTKRGRGGAARLYRQWLGRTLAATRNGRLR